MHTTNSFDLTRPIPILLLSDAPDSLTGLGRICHDLSRLLSTMPEFKVGVLGRASLGRTNYPWTGYSFGIQDGWGQNHLLEAWADLSQGAHGIILTVWDATRLMWFSHPEYSGLDDKLQRGLGPARTFERWGYFMQDCDGITQWKLPLETEQVMRQYDRVLFASRWAREIGRNSLDPAQDVDWMPHGINTTTFQPRGAIGANVGNIARSFWNVSEDEILIGCQMSNQERKHWPTVLEAIVRMQGKPKLWIKTDRLQHYWNIEALAIEYGLGDRVTIETRSLTDSELAARYSSCDATVLISGGEGFCYPVAESLACGVPVVTGCYGAQAELTPWTIPVQGYRIETVHAVRRAYYDAANVAKMLDRVVAENRNQEKREECVGLVTHLDWQRLGIPWKKWFQKGLA